MARRRSAAGSVGGGEVIPSLRPDRARLITGAGALALLAGVGGYSAFSGARFVLLADAAGGAGLVVLLVGLVFRIALTIPWAVVLAAADYLTGRAHRHHVDGWAAVVGGALLLAAELGAWSIDHDRRLAAERKVVTRQTATITTLVVVGMLIGFVLLGASGISTGAGLLITAVGVAAAVTAVGLIQRLVRS